MGSLTSGLSLLAFNQAIAGSNPALPSICREMFQGGERASKACWVGSIPTPGANALLAQRKSGALVMRGSGVQISHGAPLCHAPVD